MEEPLQYGHCTVTDELQKGHWTGNAAGPYEPLYRSMKFDATGHRNDDRADVMLPACGMST